MENKILVVTEGSFNDLSCAQNTNKLLDIISNFFGEIYLVSYTNEELINLQNNRIYNLKNTNNFLRSFFSKQFRVTLFLFNIYKKKQVRTVMFAFGNDLLILPILFAKILNMKVILRSDGKPSVTTKYNLKYYIIFKYLIKIIEYINYRISDIFLTESYYMINKYNLKKFNAQIGSLYIDSNRFKKIKLLNNRKFELGFIGRLDNEKQPLNFIKSIKNLNLNVNVLIIGHGPEEKEVISEINKINNQKIKHIKYVDWVKNENLPLYLNEIKIFILPSLREGLPNTLLEAMACGCIVLATDVGGIKGVIKKNYNGYLLENTTPKCISKSIINILKSEDLEKVSENAAENVKSAFSHDIILKKWKNLFLSSNHDNLSGSNIDD